MLEGKEEDLSVFRYSIVATLVFVFVIVVVLDRARTCPDDGLLLVWLPVFVMLKMVSCLVPRFCDAEDGVLFSSQCL